MRTANSDLPEPAGSQLSTQHRTQDAQQDGSLRASHYYSTPEDASVLLRTTYGLYLT